MKKVLGTRVLGWGKKGPMKMLKGVERSSGRGGSQNKNMDRPWYDDDRREKRQRTSKGKKRRSDAGNSLCQEADSKYRRKEERKNGRRLELLQE